MLKKILNLLNKIIPKKNIIIFNSFPDFSGNTYALYEYILKHESKFVKENKLIWTVNDKIKDNIVPDIILHSGCKILRKKSFLGLYTFLRSRLVITTHNYITGIYSSGDQKNINLWHGMPFKKIGDLLDEKNDLDKLQADYTICTSHTFQEIMSKAFRLPKNKIWITGQPINDLLYCKNNSLQQLGIDTNLYNKVILWMPTYRKSIIGSIHEDGDTSAFGAELILKDYYLKTIEFLKQEKILLLIKPHPMDILNTFKIKNSSNLMMIYQSDLERCKVNIYELLASVDGLITDYSSVYIDYLSVNKPIAFIYDDIKMYSSSRGFCFENPENYLPGPKIKDFDQMKNYFLNFEKENEKWDLERIRVREILNSQYKEGACMRVYKSILKI